MMSATASGKQPVCACSGGAVASWRSRGAVLTTVPCPVTGTPTGASLGGIAYPGPLPCYAEQTQALKYGNHVVSSGYRLPNDE